MTPTSLELKEALREFTDYLLREYLSFAGEFRDQRAQAESPAEAAFWNAIVNLCVEERRRRDAEIRRLEYMYRTGRDIEHP
ncbi:MAG: hypothetical protein D6690_16885 [Nitrospirae bacterium]|nr:MAG: hypothetical protein D6690_16885 [Nitrospirota bacterium]